MIKFRFGHYILVALLGGLLCGVYSCRSNSSKTGSGTPGSTQVSSIQANTEDLSEQWNVSILLDLSERINPIEADDGVPTSERDTSIVAHIVSLFRDRMERQGAFRAKSKMQFYFLPHPTDPELNKRCEQLSADLSDKESAEKKKIYDELPSKFGSNLKAIYDKALQEAKWNGSDIWGFFKYDVVNYCIMPKGDKLKYRNILVILTDGYIYDIQSRTKEGSRYSYLLAPLIESSGLRQSSWKEKADQMDFGLIAPQTDLSDLEVLFLGIRPTNPADQDVITYVLDKWMREMKVARWDILRSDMTANIKPAINRFFLY